MAYAYSTPLQVRCGTAGAYALELRVAGAIPRLLPDGTGHRAGEVPAGWSGAAVLVADDERGTLQMYVLTPADRGPADDGGKESTDDGGTASTEATAGAVGDHTFHGFHVRGAFTAEVIGGKPRDVNLAWAAWRGP